MLYSTKYVENGCYLFGDVHNGNNSLEEFFELGVSVPESVLVDYLNLINAQGITHIDLKNRVYAVNSETLSVYMLSSGERIFLISAIADYTHTKIVLLNVLEQLSKSVLDVYLYVFKDSDYIEVIDPINYYERRCIKRYA